MEGKVNEIFRIGRNVEWAKEPTAELIGGKALSLYRMTKLGLAVPPAIVIPTSVTFEYQDNPKGTLTALRGAVIEGLKWIEEKVGRKTLFSVRSGAPVSMPGMMDTVLNLGLNDKTFKDIAEILGTAAVADTAKRLVTEYGKTVVGLTGKIEGDAYEALAADLRSMMVIDQIMHSVEAVFKSWNSPRAIEYRKLNNVSETLGTAVTIQAMVYGNLNNKSGSGVMFSRDPATGENTMIGEWLKNAQGEDVVSGTVTPDKIDTLEPEIFSELYNVAHLLEIEFKDAVDVEFTIEDGTLYILQARRAKRTDKAAVVIAADLLDAGRIEVSDLSKYVTRNQILRSGSTVIVSTGKATLLGKGIPAGGGVGRGLVTTSIEVAINCTVPFVLCRDETLPDDIAAMNKATAILTKTGGATSHAAVVSRAMNKPCVVGFTDLNLFSASHVVVNGETGEVWEDNDGTVKIAEGSDEAVLRLAVAVAKKLERSLRYKHALDGVQTVISVGDLVSHTGALTQLVKDFGEKDIVIDLGPVPFHEDDAEIWAFVAPSTVGPREAEVRKVVGKLLKKKLPKKAKKPQVIDGNAGTVKIVTTVEELFSGELVIPTPELSATLGSKEFKATLIKKLGAPNVFVPPKTPHELVFGALAL
jgi:pyruvate,orthophosphate dikinase